MDNFKNIFIPLISSIIGGLLTLIGVNKTIKYETRKDEEREKLNAKPIFYVLDKGMRSNGEPYVSFRFLKNNNENTNYRLIDGFIKNTDKSIFTIEYVLINNTKYNPVYGEVVDKNTKVRLMVDDYENIKNKDCILVIRDTLNNKYQYKLKLGTKDEKDILKKVDEI